MEIELIEKTVKKYIDFLLDRLQTTQDVKEANKIGFLLIDNFKDGRIETVLLDMLKQKKFENYNGTLFHIYSETFTQVENLKFVIKTLLDYENDGEIYMACTSIIIDTPPPIDIKIINDLLKYLRRRLNKKKISAKEAGRINELINFYLVQRDLYYFYKQYHYK